MMLDLTSILSTIITGVFSVMAIIIPLILQKYLKDKSSAQTLSTAISNSLGAIQQAAEKALTSTDPKIVIPGVSPDLVAGVQYVLDHAGDEAARFNITPVAIADKISAQIGLMNIKSNLAVASSTGPTPAPMSPVPPMSSTAPLRSRG
jgi:hypothetical protein